MNWIIEAHFYPSLTDEEIKHLIDTVRMYNTNQVPVYAARAIGILELKVHRLEAKLAALTPTV